MEAKFDEHKVMSSEPIDTTLYKSQCTLHLVVFPKLFPNNFGLLKKLAVGIHLTTFHIQLKHILQQMK